MYFYKETKGPDYLHRLVNNTQPEFGRGVFLLCFFLLLFFCVFFFFFCVFFFFFFFFVFQHRGSTSNTLDKKYCFCVFVSPNNLSSRGWILIRFIRQLQKHRLSNLL